MVLSSVARQAYISSINTEFVGFFPGILLAFSGTVLNNDTWNVLVTVMSAAVTKPSKNSGPPIR